MSALPLKADIDEHDEHVRFVPKADIGHREARCLAANVAKVLELLRKP
jgi:hypothetical protein